MGNVKRPEGLYTQSALQVSLDSCSTLNKLKLEIITYALYVWFNQEKTDWTNSKTKGQTKHQETYIKYLTTQN